MLKQLRFIGLWWLLFSSFPVSVVGEIRKGTGWNSPSTTESHPLQVGVSYPENRDVLDVKGVGPVCSVKDRNIYKYYRDLINFRQKGDPAVMLRIINPSEAKLIDAAAGIHVKFRLAGVSRWWWLWIYQILTKF